MLQIQLTGLESRASVRIEVSVLGVGNRDRDEWPSDVGDASDGRSTCGAKYGS